MNGFSSGDVFDVMREMHAIYTFFTIFVFKIFDSEDKEEIIAKMPKFHFGYEIALWKQFSQF